MAPLITARELTRSYGPRTLFDGLSLTISEGDRVGVIGPNGAGKTTLLRILSGAEEPDGGELHRRRRLRVAMVAQDDVFDPEATVVEVATRGAALDPERIEDETERQVRVAIALDQLGFRSPEQPVGELSGGWRKRLAIAAALAARSRGAVPRRAHQPPRSRRHPVAREDAAARADCSPTSSSATTAPFSIGWPIG